MEKLLIPALRGIFGDWIYYSCVIPMQEAAQRIDFANEIHTSTKLSDMIQREIKKRRGVEISNYLKAQKERFFNSMVVAVYGGKPTWYEADIKSRNKEVSVDEIHDNALHSFGFLHFSGREKLFALDGQHRLAGMKRAVKEGHITEDEVSVILVAHTKTSAGLRRTRQLFTTLNKTAVPVSKGEKIALDENDVMAIVARRLVEENPDFSGDRIAFNATNNLAVNDVKSLTTIGNLYDILSILYVKVLKRGTLKALQFTRPSDDALADYYKQACDFFELLQGYIPELKEYVLSENFSAVVKKYRGTFGGSLTFRPIGLTILMETIERLSGNRSLDNRIRTIAKLPRNLAEEPFIDVLWDSKSKVMVNQRKVLARNLWLCMLGEIKPTPDLLKSYAAALGKEPAEVQLPTL
jgi:DNA sulfur modification protein DndB